MTSQFVSWWTSLVDLNRNHPEYLSNPMENLHLGDECFRDLVAHCHDDHVRVHKLSERPPEALREGRVHATARPINQLAERFTRESKERLIAAAKGDTE